MRWAGCWDVVAWRNDEIAFIESKGSEGLEVSQLEFLEKGLALGIPISTFSLAVGQLTGNASPKPQRSSRGSARGNSGGVGGRCPTTRRFRRFRWRSGRSSEI